MVKKIRTSITQQEIIEDMSGHFMTTNLNDIDIKGYEVESIWDLEETDFMYLIEQHAWQPFEYWNGADVYDVIDSAARSQVDTLKSFGIEVTE
jgi:hypothetical protein